VRLNGYDIKVVEMKGRRVSKLLLTPAPEHERPPQPA
jgi:CBS domain containing-hemolysin-like protein